VIRGGGWRGNAERCQAASRRSRAPSNRDGNLGLRLALVGDHY